MSHWSWQWTRVIHRKQLWGKPPCNHLCQRPRCKTRGPIKYGRFTQGTFIYAYMFLSPCAHFMYLFKQEDPQQASYNNGGFKLEVMAYIITILLRHETSFKLLFWQYSNSLCISMHKYIFIQLTGTRTCFPGLEKSWRSMQS